MTLTRTLRVGIACVSAMFLTSSLAVAQSAAQVALRRYLVANPAATLDTMIASNGHDMFNAASALLSAPPA